MLAAFQAVAFAGCVLIDLLPSTEVDCRFGVPLATWSRPAVTSDNAPDEHPAPSPPSEPCAETAG